MFGELGLRPVEVHHEHLQSVQLPEQILRGGRAVTAGGRRGLETEGSSVVLLTLIM